MTVSAPQEFGALTVCLVYGELPDDSWYFVSPPTGSFPFTYSGVSLAIKETDQNPEAPLLKPPTSFTKIGTVQAGGPPPITYFVWRPDAPSGYLAFTDLITDRGTDPNNDPAMFRQAVCVCVGQQSDGHTYVHLGAPVVPLVAGTFAGFWEVMAPQSTTTADGILASGGRSLVYSPDGEPVDAPVQNLLSLPPVVVEGAPPVVPTMANYNEPEQQTTVTTDREVIVPCTAIKDAAKSLDWQLANSPYYKVVRRRYYSLALYMNNQGGHEQELSKDFTYGVSDTQTQQFSTSVDVTVSSEAGVDLFAEAKVSASLSVDLGYSTSTAVDDFQQVTYNQTLTVDPKSAGAMYNEAHEIDVVRQDGTSASSTGALQFDADSSIYYVSYPPPPEGKATRLGARPANPKNAR